LDVGVLAAVSKADEPVLTTSRLESHLKVRLGTVSSLVPSGAWATVVIGSSLLVQNEIVVQFGYQEETARVAWYGFNVPLKVWLVDPGIGRDALAILSLCFPNVEESTELALDSDLDSNVVYRVEDVRVGARSRDESPLEVCLVNGVPLSNWGVVGSGGTLDVQALSAVDEANEPPTITRGLETNLQVSLLSISLLVPRGDRTTIVGGCALLVNNEVSVYGGGKVENVVSTGSSFDVPLKVWLVDPGVGRDALAILCLCFPQVQVGSQLTLDSDGNVGVYE